MGQVLVPALRHMAMAGNILSSSLMRLLPMANGYGTWPSTAYLGRPPSYNNITEI